MAPSRRYAASRMRKPMHAGSAILDMREVFAAGTDAERRGLSLEAVLEERLRARDRARHLRAQIDEIRMTRRALIGAGAAVVGAGLLGVGATRRSSGSDSVAAGATAPTTYGRPRVVIVGAGLAGLRCADLLWSKQQVLSAIYDADDTHIGGRCWSLRGFFGGGLVGEHGGAFIDSTQHPIRRLAADLGLQEERINGGDLRTGVDVYWVNDKRYTHAEAAADWHAFGHAAFRKAYKIAPWPQRYDHSSPGGRRLDRISVPEWLDQSGIGAGSNFGQLMQSNVICEYGGDPADQPALNLIYLMAWNGNSLDPLAGDDERWHIVGGNDQIVAGLVKRLPDGSIHQGQVLEAVRRNSDGSTTCTFTSGGTTTDVRAGRLVLALPFSTLRRVDLSKAGLSPRKMRAITQLGMGQNAKIHVGLSHKTWPKHGYAGGTYTGPEGYQCSWDDSAAYGPDQKPAVLLGFPGGSVARNHLTGSGHAPAPQADVRWFLDQIDRMFPGTSAAATGRAWEDHWSRDPWHLGAYRYLAPGPVHHHLRLRAGRRGQHPLRRASTPSRSSRDTLTARSSRGAGRPRDSCRRVTDPAIGGRLRGVGSLVLFLFHLVAAALVTALLTRIASAVGWGSDDGTGRRWRRGMVAQARSARAAAASAQVGSPGADRSAPARPPAGGPRDSPRVALLLDRPLHLAASVALRDRVALVDALLAAGQPQLELDLAAGQVQRQRHQRHPALEDLRAQLLDLAAGGAAACAPGADVVLDVPRLYGAMLARTRIHPALAQLRVALAEVAAAVTQRLHLGTGQRDAAPSPAPRCGSRGGPCGSRRSPCGRTCSSDALREPRQATSSCWKLPTCPASTFCRGPHRDGQPLSVSQALSCCKRKSPEQPGPSSRAPALVGISANRPLGLVGSLSIPPRWPSCGYSALLGSASARVSCGSSSLESGKPRRRTTSDVLHTLQATGRAIIT